MPRRFPIDKAKLRKQAILRRQAMINETNKGHFRTYAHKPISHTHKPISITQQKIRRLEKENHRLLRIIELLQHDLDDCHDSKHRLEELIQLVNTNADLMTELKRRDALEALKAMKEESSDDDDSLLNLFI